MPIVLAAVVVAVAVSSSVPAAGQDVAPGRRCATWDPAWSPDGSRIAFGVTDGQEPVDPTGNTGGQIESVDPAGTTVQVLTQPPPRTQLTELYAHDLEPAWAPDGRRLAFVRDSPYYNGSRTWESYSVSVLDTTSGVVTRIGDGSDPTWSRTGALAYDIFDGPYLDPAGFVAGSRTIPGAIAGPSWSPDGRRLTYEGDYVSVIDRNGAHRRRLVRGGAAPSWSPDGRWIAYRTPNGKRLDLVSPDGKRHRRLAGLDSLVADAPIVWSPSGARLAVGTTIVTLATGKVRQLDIDLTNLYPYLSYTGPSWSPDGRWLVYARDAPMSEYGTQPDGLEIVHPDGSGYHTVNPCGLAPSTP
jgi:Tol biopolymer transport system component